MMEGAMIIESDRVLINGQQVASAAIAISDFILSYTSEDSS